MVREHSVHLRGSEIRALATTGAFRVVHAGDLRDSQDRSLDPRSGELRHLREQGLVETIPTIGDGRALVVLTERGRDVLERNRAACSATYCDWRVWSRTSTTDARLTTSATAPRSRRARQQFYSGLQAPYRRRARPTRVASRREGLPGVRKEAERLREDGAVIRRVMLDTELKREYQQFLQEHNRGKSDSDGRPDRTPDEIARWAMDHDLPEKDGHVQFPDARIVYEDRDGPRTRDIEVETLNYRGAHASAKASSGFSRHSAGTARVVGSRGGGGGGSRRGAAADSPSPPAPVGAVVAAPDPRLAEELLR